MLDVGKPMAGFGMDVNFVDRVTFEFMGINAQNQVAVGRTRIASDLLVPGQIPVRVQPVRIAGRQKQLARAIALGQFGLRRLKLLGGRHRTQGIFLTRTADWWRGRTVAFQQNGGDLKFFVPGRSADSGFNRAFGF